MAPTTEKRCRTRSRARAFWVVFLAIFIIQNCVNATQNASEADRPIELTTISDHNAERPMLLACETTQLTCIEAYTSETSYFQLFPSIRPHCNGELRSVTFFSHGRGQFYVGLFTRASIVAGGWVLVERFRVTADNDRPRFVKVVAPSGIPVLNTYSLGVWYETTDTPWQANPLRHMTATSPNVCPCVLEDVCTFAIEDTLLMNMMDQKTRVLDLKHMIKTGKGTCLRQHVLPGLSLQVKPSTPNDVPPKPPQPNFMPKCCMPPYADVKTRVPPDWFPTDDDESTQAPATVRPSLYYDWQCTFDHYLSTTHSFIEFINMDTDYSKRNSFQTEEVAKQECSVGEGRSNHPRHSFAECCRHHCRAKELQTAPPEALP